MFYLENSLIDKNYTFCTWIGELNTWYVLFSNNAIVLLKQNYKGPCTILWTPRESHIRKSLKPQRASREVPCSPLFASQWAGSRASSGHLTSSLLAFNWRSQLLMVLDSVVKPSIYLKWKKGLRLRYRWKISKYLLFIEKIGIKGYVFLNWSEVSSMFNSGIFRIPNLC